MTDYKIVNDEINNIIKIIKDINNANHNFNCQSLNSNWRTYIYLNYKDVLKYDEITNKVYIPIFKIKNNYYIDSMLIIHCFKCYLHTPETYTINNFPNLTGILSNYNGIPIVYYRVNYNLEQLIKKEKTIEQLKCQNHHNHTAILFYEHIEPVIIEKLLPEEHIELLQNELNDLKINLNIKSEQVSDKIRKLELENTELLYKLSNLEFKNNELKNKIRNMDLELHYLKLDSSNKKIKYNYDDIKKRNKLLNQEFKRVYKLISKNIGFNLNPFIIFIFF